MPDEPEPVLTELLREAERRYGATRAADLRGHLQITAAAIAAIAAYPLADTVDPALAPVTPDVPPSGEQQV